METAKELVCRVAKKEMELEKLSKGDLAEFVLNEDFVSNEMFDEHRWYNVHEIVILLEDRYIAFNRNVPRSSEHCIGDMDIDQIEDDFWEVRPIEVVITKYVPKVHFQETT